MKSILITLFTCIVLVMDTFAQTDKLRNRFGIIYIQNFSAQINYNPQIPEDGRFQWNTLPTFGIGTFYEKMFGEKLGLTTQAMFQLKGYKEIAQIAELFIPNSFRENEYANKFRYITLEVNPIYYFSKPNIITPYISAGLNGNFLLSSEIGSDVYPIQSSYPVNEYDNFRKWSLGYNLSAGVILNNLVSLEGKFHEDITPILNKDNLQIWNWVWSINLKLNVGQIITDIHNKSRS